MHIEEYVKKQIEKFASPSLTLGEEIILATTMEDCRNKILKQIYDKRYFIDNLMEDIKKIHPKSRHTLLDGFTTKTMQTRELIGLIKKYIANPNLKLANEIEFDYVYISNIADHRSKIAGVKPILDIYYQARNKLIQSNVKKLLPICYQYTGNTPFEDIYQTMIYAMIRASGKYSSAMGFHFGTFATWWVRHELQKYTRKDTTIEIPFDKYKEHSTNERELNRKEQKECRNIPNPCDHPTYISEIENEEGEMVPIFDVVDCKNSNNEYITILKAIIKRKMQNLKKDHQYILSNLIGLDGPPLGVDELAAELKTQPRNVIKRAKYALKKLKISAEVKFPK